MTPSDRDPRHPLLTGCPEPDAVEWGEDRHGVFQGFSVGGVVFRFRWIPPGTFTMGSPKGEAGRYEREGPQHDVTIAHGFWLGETPVTQALWQAVMGQNPSRFQTPDRPVEQVSWDDCRGFLERLNVRMPRLGARLPSEAEWEYACRAGTTAATWIGDLKILGDHNAPLLDAIAWYGGNSGRGFDVPKGHNTTNWRDKQYSDTRAGSHPVGQKAANPWGLRDMLGNVWEWCADDWHGPGAWAPADGRPRDDEPRSSNRVIRGGSWHSVARLVSAAYRRGCASGFRDGNLGFRLARGQGALPHIQAGGPTRSR